MNLHSLSVKNGAIEDKLFSAFLQYRCVAGLFCYGDVVEVLLQVNTKEIDPLHKGAININLMLF